METTATATTAFPRELFHPLFRNFSRNQFHGMTSRSYGNFLQNFLMDSQEILQDIFMNFSESRILKLNPRGIFGIVARVVHTRVPRKFLKFFRNHSSCYTGFIQNFLHEFLWSPSRGSPESLRESVQEFLQHSYAKLPPSPRFFWEFFKFFPCNSSIFEPPGVLKDSYSIFMDIPSGFPLEFSDEFHRKSSKIC